MFDFSELRNSDAEAGDGTKPPLTVNGMNTQVSIGSWTKLTQVEAPISTRHHSAFAFQNHLLIWSGTTHSGERTYTGGRYSLDTSKWDEFATMPEPLDFDTAVWTGEHLVVFAHAETASPKTSFNVYNATSNIWQSRSVARSFRFDVRVAAGDYILSYGNTADVFADKSQVLPPMRLVQTDGKLQPLIFSLVRHLNLL